MPILTPLQTALAVSLFSSLLLLLVFAFLHRQYRERHMRLWTLSWLCYNARLGCDYLRQAGVAPESIDHLIAASALLAGIFLLFGTAEFVGTKVSRVWLAIALANLGWDAAVHFMDLPVEWARLPIFAFYAAMTIWTGWLLVQASQREEWAQQGTGWLLFLWGLHKLDYPFRWSHPQLAPFAFLLGAFFALAVALCMLLAYFQKARQLLHGGQALLQSVLDHTDSAIMALDAEFRVTFVNRRYLDMWPFEEAFLAARPTIGAVIGEACRRGLYPQEQVDELIARRMEQLTCTGGGTTLETPRCDGMLVEGFATTLPEGGYLLSFRDVTARQRAEEQLQRSRKHLHTLVETVPHGILECDLQGLVTYANGTYAAMQEKVRPGGLGGHSIFDLIGDDESRAEARETFARHLREGRERGVELVRNRDRDGRALWRQVDWAVRRNAGGAINGFIGVVTDVTAQQQAEAQMRTANELLRQLFHAAPMAIVTLDHSGEILLWNRAAETIFGWSEEAVAGERFHQLTLRAVEQEPFIALLRQAGSGKIVRSDLAAVHRDGREIDVTMVVGPLQGNQEHAAEVIVIVDDISERKRVESALRHSEETYRSLVEKTPVAVFVHVNGSLVYLNPAAVELFGASSASELEGEALADYLDASDRELFGAAAAEGQRKAAQANRLRLKIRPHGGATREVEATFLDVEYSSRPARMALCLDVTERNRAERELRAQADFMQMVLDTIPAPIFYKDAAGLYLGCNRAFAAFHGREPAQIVGRDVFALAPPELAAIYRDADLNLLQQGGTQVYETEVEAATGERRAVLFTKAVFLQEDGAVGGLVGTMLDISERKRAEEALRVSERKYRAIFDQAFQFSGLLDPDGRLLEANRSALEFIDASEDELRGRFFWETPWWSALPEYQQRVRKAIEQAACGESARFEALNRGCNGQERWIDFSLKPVRDDGGQIVYLIPEGHDITERKRTEELTLLVARGVSAEVGDGFFRSLTRTLAQALEADYAFVSEIAEGQMQIVAGVDHGAEMTPFKLELLGTPCAEVAANGVFRAYAQGLRRHFPQNRLLAELQAEGYAGSPLLAADGRTLGILFVLFVQPIKDAAQVESLLRIFASRAAAELERRRAERILEESEARFRRLSHEFETIFDGIPDSLTVWSPEMKLVWANRATQTFYRPPDGVLEGLDCQTLCRLGCCAELDCEIRRCFVRGAHEDVVRTTADGRSWGIKTFPLRDEEGRLMRVIRLASDVSERLRLREEAARSAHLAALGELAAGVAHEINNPTGLILLEMPILRDAFRDLAPLLDAHFRREGDFLCAGMKFSLLRQQLPVMIEEIADGARRIKQIVDELKDFSAPGSAVQLDAVDLNEVVRKAINLIGNQMRNLTDNFAVDYSASPALVEGNFQRLEQVLINLLLNAGQALRGRDGQVTVAIDCPPGQGQCQVAVRDDGVGILPEHLTQITDPFFTTRRATGGTGLGLSVSQRIVAEHGGTLHFDSTPGAGTVVTVQFPSYAKEAKP